MENQFLIPANSKRAQLIFSVFRPVDLIIASVGAGLTLMLFVIVQPQTLLSAAIVLAPILVCSFLVIPVPNYHNMLCVLQNIYKFYFEEKQQFIWKGWCVKDEFKD